MLAQALCDYSAVVLTGSRQWDKSTLLKMAFSHWPVVSLEDLDLREFAQRDARAFLKQCPPPLIIDEAQHVPDFFIYLDSG